MDYAANGAPVTPARTTKASARAGAVLGSGTMVTVMVEEVGDRIVDGQEALEVAG